LSLYLDVSGGGSNGSNGSNGSKMVVVLVAELNIDA